MEKEYKILGQLTVEELSLLIRNFYLTRGFSDSKYLDSFEKWFLQNLDKPIETLENAFLKTMFVSSTVLETKYAKFKIIFCLSLLGNLSFIFYLLFRG